MARRRRRGTPAPAPLAPAPAEAPPKLLTRAEIALLRQAGRARWNVPDALRDEALHQLYAVLAASEDDRARVSAAKALVACDRADDAAEKLDLERRKQAIAEAATAAPSDGRTAGDVLREFLDGDDRPAPA